MRAAEALKKIMESNEAEAYFALLSAGPSTATTLAKKTGIHRSSIYDALEKLGRKGLASHITRNSAKYFEASSPETILSFFREKEKEARCLINELSRKQSAPEKFTAQILEGYEALKKIMSRFIDLSSKTEYLSYGIPPEFPKHLASWLKIHHKERIRKKAKIRILFSRGAEKRAEEINSMPFASAKCLPESLDSPATSEISGNELSIIHWAEKPLIIHIQSREIAESYRKHFNFLWQTITQRRP